MGIYVDLTGQTFNQLTVIKEVWPKKHCIKWVCLCTCGNTSKVATASLKNGNTKSCGCLVSASATERFTKHGARNSKLYQIHTSMLTRCRNKANQAYLHYGAKGISVCQDWLDFENFQSWADTNGYLEGLTLDRKDPNGNYEPNNCRWTTSVIQARNRKPFKNSSSKYIGVSWDSQYSKWTASVGLNYKVVHLGRHTDEVSAAKARDFYITQNSLEGFTLNFT